jgi:hypothetical protein
MEALTVCCVKWGSRYGAEWVLRLRSMVAKHLSLDHRFVCFTDSPIDGVECRPLEPNLPNWWSKLSLFKPGQFSGPVLYLDLDVVITGNIDALVLAAQTDLTKLWMRDDFSYSLRKPRKDIGFDTERLLGGVGCCNSSVMLWRADAARDVWDTFKPSVMTHLHGDQNHISQVMWPDKIGFLPDELVCSYKYQVLREKKTAPVIVFHGNPKPNDLGKGDELRKLWEVA